jgi:hypothetical protein
MHGLFGDFGIIAATEIICNCPLKKKEKYKTIDNLLGTEVSFSS